MCFLGVEFADRAKLKEREATEIRQRIKRFFLAVFLLIKATVNLHGSVNP
jgi:hypothetical protein